LAAASLVVMVMDALERCLESVAFCHLQEEPRWAAARAVVQQDIDGYIAAAGASPQEKRDALVALMERFCEKFPDERNDPVLVRSYIRSQLRKIEFDLKHEDDRRLSVDTIAEPAPSTVPLESTESLPPMTDDELQDAQSESDTSHDNKARDPCA
jgi:hypothetical protein